MNYLQAKLQINPHYKSTKKDLYNAG